MYTLKLKSHQHVQAVYEALYQYVENGDCCSEEMPESSQRLLEPARELMEDLDKWQSSFADLNTG